MDTGNSKNRKKKNKKDKHAPKLTKKNLDRFLSSICEEAGMTAPKKKVSAKKVPIQCKASCEKAEWRAHLDIDSGVLCVSSAWSTNKHAHKHRDITLSATYLDEAGHIHYSDMVFCDGEIRWLMETLWHAPIWETDD